MDSKIIILLLFCIDLFGQSFIPNSNYTARTNVLNTSSISSEQGLNVGELVRMANGSEYLISSDSITGYENDLYGVIDIGSKYAILQPKDGYNVKHFGAVGDSSVNDLSAFHRAIKFISLNGGGKLYVPAGTYRFDSAMQFSNSTLTGTKGYIYMYGEGDVSRLVCPDTTSSYGTIRFLNTLTNITLENLSIEGKNEISTGLHVVYIQDFINNISFRNITFQWAKTSGVIYFGSGENVIFNNCVFKNISTTGMVQNAGGGIFGGDIINLSVFNCKFINTGNNSLFHAAYIENSNNVSVNNCFFEGENSRLHVYNGIGKNITINSNIFKSVENITLWNAPNINFTGNVLQNSTVTVGSNYANIVGNSFILDAGTNNSQILYQGIACSGVNISNNSFSSSISTGNSVCISRSHSGSDWLISNNIFNGFPYAIRLEGGTNTTILNNIIKHTGASNGGVAAINLVNSTTGTKTSGNIINTTASKYIDSSSGTNYSFLNGDSNESMVIGASSPNQSAALEILSTTKGFLPPRLTTTERNAISSPAAGLVIYNSTDNKHQGYNGLSWSDLTTGGNITVTNQATTGTYVVTSTDYYIRINAATGTQTYTLPTPTSGRVLKFYRVDNNPGTAVIFTGTVNGTTNPTSTTGGSPIEQLAYQYGAISLIGNGSSWDKAN